MRKNNKLLKTGYVVFLCLSSICSPIQKGYAMDEEGAFWQDYQKWFECKKSQPINELQKKVISYLEKASSIFEKGDETWGMSMKRPELPKPEEALKIVNKCLNEFSKLKAPSVAEKHYAASLNLLKIIKEYHLKRLSDPNSSELEQLARDAIPYEGIQSSEYFDILRKAGLFDNIEEEMKRISDTSGKDE